MPDRHAELLAMLHTLKLPAMADTFTDLALKAAVSADLQVDSVPG